jgi:hypothetical protein
MRGNTVGHNGEEDLRSAAPAPLLYGFQVLPKNVLRSQNTDRIAAPPIVDPSIVRRSRDSSRTKEERRSKVVPSRTRKVPTAPSVLLEHGIRRRRHRQS